MSKLAPSTKPTTDSADQDAGWSRLKANFAQAPPELRWLAVFCTLAAIAGIALAFIPFEGRSMIVSFVGTDNHSLYTAATVGVWRLIYTRSSTICYIMIGWFFVMAGFGFYELWQSIGSISPIAPPVHRYQFLWTMTLPILLAQALISPRTRAYC